MSGKFWTRVIPVVKGCSPASEGCARCWHAQEYHMRSHQKNPKIRARYAGFTEGKGRWNGRVEVDMTAFDRCAKDKPGQVYMVLSDLYHEGVTDEQIDDAFSIMARCLHHTFLIITKRPSRRLYITPDGTAPKVITKIGDKIIDGPLPNVWHIVTVENQARADERIPHLLRIPGKRGIIIEPMLEAVDFGKWLIDKEGRPSAHYVMGIFSDDWTPPIHQVILGGESGPGARPMHPDWVRSVRDQCKAAGVPFYSKGWGKQKCICYLNAKAAKQASNGQHGGYECPIHDWKQEQGRLLDGREHNDLAWRG